jgi:Flp pilus assembly protein TadD
MSESSLKIAFALHQAGNLAEAARLYGEILEAEPNNFDALYLLGFVHFQRSDYSNAERLMGEALKFKRA